MKFGLNIALSIYTKFVLVVAPESKIALQRGVFGSKMKIITNVLDSNPPHCSQKAGLWTH